MDPRAWADSDPTKDPDLPALVKVGDVIAPRAPQTLETTGLEESTIPDLMVRLAYTVARFTTEWVGKQLNISPSLGRQLLDKMAFEGHIEQLWTTSEKSAHYKITDAGRELAERLMKVSGYIGPAPVSLEQYSAMLRYQFANTPQVTPEMVVNALQGIVLSPKAAQFAGLAVASGRSLFVYGPPGNGKSTLGRQILSALPGDVWIPYSISLGETVARVYDSHLHTKIDVPGDRPDLIDQRWVRIRRPLIIVGGELTLEMLDLMYMPSQHYYEAPPHLKSNGGVFLVDDFGRERMSPEMLLNRFITPMEHQIDYFTLRTGHKIQMPLKHVLIIATNLSPEKVTDPAFLRRMGYRCYLGAPNAEQYTKIFNQYAAKAGVSVAPEVIEQILDHYRIEDREMRACEPRDLIERSKDICKFHNRPLELTPKVLELAWAGYFGHEIGKGKGAAAREKAAEEAAAAEQE
jgi:DNA-binding PadR family transcriptional regulator